MFNKNFYPTPKQVIDRTLVGVDIENKIVLEPNGGKGDAILALKGYGAKTVITCEINKDLASIAASKADVFLTNDFFDVTSDEISHVDVIWMNPPFDNGDKHILHAWDIAPEGCVITALCNYETVNNRYSRTRQSLSNIINQNGNYENLGDCFSEAERQTDVDVALVRLFKPIKSEDKEFENYFDLNEEYENSENGVLKYDELRNIVQRYIGAVKMFESVISKANEINQLIDPISNKLDIKFGAYQHNGYGKITRDVFKKQLQKSAWHSVFDKMKMQKYVTSKIMDKINKFVEKQENVPFTLNNIYKMIDMIIGTHADRMNDVIIEMFDWLTEHHHDNRFQKEGWKTNSEYIVNKKFIAPYLHIGIGWSHQPEIRWTSAGNKMDELTKALCLITASNYDDCITMDELFRSTGEKENKEYKEFSKWYDFNFFEIKVYKKGTCHAKFKDDSVWVQFNKTAAKAKGFQLASKFTGDFRKKSSGVEVF